MRLLSPETPHSLPQITAAHPAAQLRASRGTGLRRRVCRWFSPPLALHPPPMTLTAAASQELRFLPSSAGDICLLQLQMALSCCSLGPIRSSRRHVRSLQRVGRPPASNQRHCAPAHLTSTVLACAKNFFPKKFSLKRCLLIQWLRLNHLNSPSVPGSVLFQRGGGRAPPPPPLSLLPCHLQSNRTVPCSSPLQVANGAQADGLHRWDAALEVRFIVRLNTCRCQCSIPSRRQ